MLKVAGERFRMLQRDEAESTEKIASGEFLDRLVLKKVGTQDSGMYICFVTSNGIGQLTYKSVDLNVVPCKQSLFSKFRCRFNYCIIYSESRLLLSLVNVIIRLM